MVYNYCPRGHIEKGGLRAYNTISPQKPINISYIPSSLEAIKLHSSSYTLKERDKEDKGSNQAGSDEELDMDRIFELDGGSR
jgi:hypothetical protein